MTGRWLRITASILLTVGLVALFLWNVDLTEVGRELGRAHPGPLAASVGLALGAYWLRALRWQLILRPVGRLHHSTVVLATASGYAAMALLPARLGDLVRPLLVVRREPQIPVSAALASVVTERIFDLWTVVAFLLVFLVAPPPMAPEADPAATLASLRTSAWVVGAGLLVGTGLLVGLLRWREGLVQRVVRPMARLRRSWADAVAGFLHHFLDGLEVVSRPRDLTLVLGASVVMWYAILWQVLFSFRALDLELPLRATILILALAVVGLMLPTPGGVGGMHATTRYGLTGFFAVAETTATSAAILYHAVSFLPITVLGLAVLPLFGVRLGEVEQLTDTTDEGTGP